MRITDAELGLIKATFADNEVLLKIIRKVFLQIKLTQDESLIFTSSVINHDAVMELLRKMILPTVDGDAPIHQVVDLWLTVNIREKTPDQSYSEIVARDILIKYLEQQFKEIEGEKPKKGRMNLADFVDIGTKSPLEVHSGLLARNTIINHIEQQISQIQILAGRREESVEETKERLQKDSTK